MVSSTLPLRAALRGPLLLPLLLAPAAEGMRQEQQTAPAEAAGPPPDLRVFAASFNAANQKYDHYDPDTRTKYEGVMSTILAGHDDPGGEADIVLLGFQEFEDDKYVLGNELRESQLWARQTTARLMELKGKADQLMVPPDPVREAADALKQEAASRHQAVESRVSEFRSKFGPSAKEFLDAVASASPVKQLLSGVEAEVAKIKEGIDSRMNAYGDAKGAAEEGQFKELSDAATAIRDFVSDFPGGAETKSRLQPIRGWKNSIKGALNEFRAEAPNFQFSDSGRGSWDAFMDGLDRDVEGTYADQQSHHQRRFQDVVSSFADGLARRAREVESSVSRPLSLDWKHISEDLQKLQDDLRAPGETLPQGKDALAAVQRHIVAEIAKVAGTHEQEMQYSLQQWARGAVDGVAGLTETPVFPQMEGFAEVKMEPQKYNSGFVCAAGSHYDTVLYAYVNPWSKWKIEAVDYSSPTCARRAVKTQKNMGCNIDNNMNGECGKVINLLVFKVSQGAVTQRFCAMNTHMSFAGEARLRMGFIQKAVVEAKAAGCQTAVFVGDFNSRLHCGKGLAAPPFDRPLDLLLDDFCTTSGSSTSCSLKSVKPSVQMWDELTQILSESSVDCHEYLSKSAWSSKKAWMLVSGTNDLRGLDFRFHEADLPQFPPTYKLGNKTEAGDGWHRCLPKTPDGPGFCFVNTDKKPKHNPAWTDRVLVSGDQYETLTYDRRMIPETFGTDHAPVVAVIKFTLG